MPEVVSAFERMRKLSNMYNYIKLAVLLLIIVAVVVFFKYYFADWVSGMSVNVSSSPAPVPDAHEAVAE